MKYKKYPSYKDSGVEWLGDIPSHWNTKRLKNVIRASITDGPHETPEFIDEGVPFLSVDGIQEGELSFKKCRYISEDAHNLYKRKAFIELDDILLGKAASIGKVARVKVDFEFSIWSPLALIKPKLDEIIPSYLEYLLKSDLTQYQIQQLSTSNTQQNISMADIPKFNFSLPELKEQQQIANYLDEKTSKIDTLIKKQTKQIELLKEKRQAVISHAVTKGINPNVPMKDSGVEWLGEIPSEWINTKLKYHSFIYNGNSISDNEKENYENLNTNFSIPYISTKDIDSNFLSIDYDNGMRISVNNDKFRRAKKGSSLICIEGGSAGKKLGLLEKDVCFVNKLACIDSYNNLDNKFCNYILRSSVFNYLFSLSTTGLIPGVSINQLKDFEIILPPLNEQQQIANYLDEKTSKIDILIEKSNKSIELLKEKRTALISAAVTGKIDVREFE